MRALALSLLLALTLFGLAATSVEPPTGDETTPAVPLPFVPDRFAPLLMGLGLLGVARVRSRRCPDREATKGANTTPLRTSTLLGLAAILTAATGGAGAATLMEVPENDASGHPTGSTLLLAHKKEGMNGLAFVARCVEGNALYTLSPSGFLPIAADRDGYAAIKVGQNAPFDLEIRGQRGIAYMVARSAARLRRQVLSGNGIVEVHYQGRHGSVLLRMSAARVSATLLDWEAGKGCTPEVDDALDEGRDTWLRSEIPEWHVPE